MDGAAPGIDLPWEFRYHCITMLNQSHSIMVGGFYKPTQSLIVNLDTFNVTKGPDLAGSGRYAHACAHIRHNNGSNFVIATGGAGTDDTSEILNTDNALQWSPGIFKYLKVDK